VPRVMVIGPTSDDWDSIAAGVEADLDRMSRPGLELIYRCTGAGPRTIRTSDDAACAAPHVVHTAVAAEREGFDGVIVDCTEDPGVAAARAAVAIPVIGAGEASRASIAAARKPIVELTGDELRASDLARLLARLDGASTVAFGGTGFSHLADALVAARPDLVVLDPLPLALEACLATIETA
jgi:Asp/Glu/hydantoin racemase